ncbi:hypothetical protein K9U40_02450 [Xanthobacter autotrophicus]|uniref:hypothetical protein n=1 Tax=Xanthobacter TaxID=279 RepID=UPI0024AC4258|nr:hypothetical protein [Xanthobacter autotrophicus]MDI4663205.1 hypothetical protein [Xanthobacter autotrophicus]
MQPMRFPLPAGALALAALMSGPVLAQARPDTLAMSCRDAAALVNARGAVVLGTGPNIYDRYVREIRFCSAAEQLKPEWVKTRDNPQCFVGYTCYVPSRDNNQAR